MKKALLVASVGSTNDDAIRLSVDTLEKTLAENFPDRDVFRAFTGERIRLLLENRKVHIDSVEEALEKLADNEYRDVFIQPSHIFAGVEYERIVTAAANHRSSFDRLTVGYPLIHDETAMSEICDFIGKKFCEKGVAVVMMGHCQTNGKSSTSISETENGDIYFTDNADSSDILSALSGRGYNKIILAPLMFTAGNHVLRDMAGDDTGSLLSRLENAGFSVTPVLHGLGEYHEIRKMYVTHAKRRMELADVPLTRDDCAALLCDTAKRLHDNGISRFPRRSDFTFEEVRAIKAFFGPWPRALEAVGLKEPRSDDRLQKNREKRIRAKRRRRLAKKDEIK